MKNSNDQRENKVSPTSLKKGPDKGSMQKVPNPGSKKSMYGTEGKLEDLKEGIKSPTTGTSQYSTPKYGGGYGNSMMQSGFPYSQSPTGSTSFPTQMGTTSGPMSQGTGMPSMSGSGATPGMMGMSPGMSGMSPGMGGMTPGMSGMSPGMSGMSPGMSGMPPGMSPGMMGTMPGQQTGFPGMTGSPQTNLPFPIPGAGAAFPGQQIPRERSYIENILRLNRGKRVRAYFTFENNDQWNAKIFSGILQEAGKDHLVIADPESGKWYLLLMIYLDYVEFDERIEYEYPFA